MNKRTDAIRRLFAADPSPPLSADNTPAPRRVHAGAVRSMKESFSDIERENEALRAQAAGERVVEIDAALVDPSPFADRFAQDDDESFQALKRSIAEGGQKIPVLLRPHPGAAGRYQIAFGHRRARVARQLERPLKAIVRALDDDALVVAQGVENAAREDLSFIERAVFALRLESAGVARTVIQQALTIDRAETSKLIAVARAVPEALARSIGKAPRIGRGRWQDFAEAIAEAGALRRVQRRADADDFSSLPSDERFAQAMEAARAPAAKGAQPQPETLDLRDEAGQPWARMRISERDLRVKLAGGEGRALARFLAQRMPALLEEFRASGEQGPDAS